jgi:hypothetical protein
LLTISYNKMCSFKIADMFECLKEAAVYLRMVVMESFVEKAVAVAEIDPLFLESPLDIQALGLAVAVVWLFPVSFAQLYIYSKLNL